MRLGLIDRLRRLARWRDPAGRHRMDASARAAAPQAPPSGPRGPGAGQAERKKLENDIRIQHKVLTDLRVNVLNNLKTLEQQYRQLQPQVAQAYADLEAFEKLSGWKVWKR